MGYMLIKLHNVIDPPASATFVAEVNKNAEAFVEIIQSLENRSLSLVIRIAKNNRLQAFKILWVHYLSKGKPQVTSLYTVLTKLQTGKNESITDSVIRAKAAAS